MRTLIFTYVLAESVSVVRIEIVSVLRRFIVVKRLSAVYVYRFSGLKGGSLTHGPLKRVVEEDLDVVSDMMIALGSFRSKRQSL